MRELETTCREHLFRNFLQKKKARKMELYMIGEGMIMRKLWLFSAEKMNNTYRV